ncbi:unnamed protein product [Mycena citricolor]|uniref:Aminoglycoside phosphotransferase domain-containing protein n=1 Tax=Mycena citricolor TaxID=2018698 RepID=A0AAD2HAM8_9AGAR|nr:unnamed protein product [Mycena citricolor]
MAVDGDPRTNPTTHDTNNNDNTTTTTNYNTETPSLPPPLEWDWDIEHADRKLERQADAALHGATPFEVDRRVLKDVVLEHMRVPVARIVFLSAGTFHKAYLITLTTGRQIIARVARRFMPRLKTESEIATLRYLRENTNVPVPEVFCYDSNPYNRLGGEWIVMSKAEGIPLSQVFHSLSYVQLSRLVENLAKLLIPLFGHRFPRIGSLYFGPDPHAPVGTNDATPTLTRASSVLSATTPRATIDPYTAFPFTPTLTPLVPPAAKTAVFHVGPIISWPFFGNHRGDLPASDVPRGPFPTTPSYIAACAQREILGVQRENAGTAPGHRLHLDPAEILASRHHAVRAVPGDESDDSDEWGLEESEDECEGPGDAMYRDYRRQARGPFLVKHMQAREDAVRNEMGRWESVMGRLVDEWAGKDGGTENFALDAHDLSLENVFVNENDPCEVTCIIDWESTTTRPLWAAAHLPAFLQPSPFTAKLFREAVSRIASGAPSSVSPSATPSVTVSTSTPSASASSSRLATLAQQWLHHEQSGMRLRMAHRVAEWDGWEEGLVESILGPEEWQDEWFHEHEEWLDGHEDLHEHDHDIAQGAADPHTASQNVDFADSMSRRRRPPPMRDSPASATSSASASSSPIFAAPSPFASAGASAKPRPKPKPKSTFLKAALQTSGGGASGSGSNLTKSAFSAMKNPEREKEQMLDHTGDICGGRGGELGRRLEAWLVIGARNGDAVEEEEVEEEAMEEH